MMLCGYDLQCDDHILNYSQGFELLVGLDDTDGAELTAMIQGRTLSVITVQ